MGTPESKVESSAGDQSQKTSDPTIHQVIGNVGRAIQQQQQQQQGKINGGKTESPTSSIVTVVSGDTGGGGGKEEDEELRMIEEIPLFLPLVPTSINRSSLFGSTDYSVLAQIQSEPLIQMAGRIQHRFKRCGAIVSHEQHSIATRMRQVETRLSKSLVSVAHINNELRVMEDHFKEIEGLAASVARAKNSLQIVNNRLQRLYNAIPVNFSAEAHLEDSLQQINRRKLVSPSQGFRPFPFMRFVSGVAFTKGRRPTMEDTHFVCDDVRPLLAKRAKFLGIQGDILEGLPPIGLFCVYDGHGGSKVAEYSAELLHVMLLDQILTAFDELKGYSKLFEGDTEEKEGSPNRGGSVPSVSPSVSSSSSSSSSSSPSLTSSASAPSTPSPSSSSSPSSSPSPPSSPSSSSSSPSSSSSSSPSSLSSSSPGSPTSSSFASSVPFSSPLSSSSTPSVPDFPSSPKSTPTTSSPLSSTPISSSPTPSPNPSSSSSSSPSPSPSPSPSAPSPPLTEQEDTERKFKRLKSHILSSITSVFENFDKFLLRRGPKEGWDGGATAVVCMMVWDKLFVGNVGDAEAVVGTLRQHKVDHEGYRSILVTEKHQPSSSDSRHKKVADKEKRRIRKAGGRVLHGRVMGALAVSRALGDRTFKMPLCEGRGDFVTATPYVRYESFANSDFLICACDGFWDTFNYQDAVDLAQEKRKLGLSPELISKLLVSAALERGSMDNISLIVAWGLRV